jgi:hypothetical protein
METIKLSSIVMKLKPDLYPCLTRTELDTTIVLRDGIQDLDKDAAVEIIQHSIFKYQKDAYLH